MQAFIPHELGGLECLEPWTQLGSNLELHEHTDPVIRIFLFDAHIGFGRLLLMVNNG